MTDFLVIGGGMAGVAAAAHLAPHGSVVLLEQETSLAYHTTGRSAATFVVNYGSPGSRSLALASRSFFDNPPDDAVDAELLTPRGVVWVGRPDQIDTLDIIAGEGRQSGADSQALSPEQTMELVPVLDPHQLGGGIYEPSAHDIDVAGLHQGFVRILRKHGGLISTNSPAVEIDRKSARWTVTTPNETFDAGVIVNAAGAWGDRVAAMADVEPIGLQPMRRTAFMVPGSEEYRSLPMVVGVDNDYYFRPDGVQLLCSLSEEEPAEPSDPKPRMEDVAQAIERINQITTLEIRTVNSQWVGLRTFAPDRELVIGEDPNSPGFYWLVGQGGSGIMTAPGYGALLAGLVLDQPLSSALSDAGVDPVSMSPGRF